MRITNVRASAGAEGSAVGAVGIPAQLAILSVYLSLAKLAFRFRLRERSGIYESIFLRDFRASVPI